MKLTRILLGTLFLLSLSSHISFSQSIDTRNKVEFIENDQEADDFNSISEVVTSSKKKVKKNIKGEREISIDDLQRLVSKRNDLRFRKKRHGAEKCTTDVKKTPCVIKQENPNRVGKDDKEARIAAKLIRLAARKAKK